MGDDHQYQEDCKELLGNDDEPYPNYHGMILHEYYHTYGSYNAYNPDYALSHFPISN